MECFRYGKKEVNYLRKKDPLMGLAIKNIGMIEREVDHDLFRSITHQIIAQQISNKALATVWMRFTKKIGDITPKKIIEVGPASLHEIGLSNRKARYITELGEAFIKGVIKEDEIKKMSDDDAIKKLTSLKGIGKWTGEMVLLFCLERENVFSEDDLAVRRGLGILHEEKSIDKDRFEYYRTLYSPYCSVASLYLWEIATRGKI